MLAIARIGETALAAGDLIEMLPAALAALGNGGEDDDGHDDREQAPERGHGRHPHVR